MARTDNRNQNRRRPGDRKVYGRAKHLEMARSVLPSTWRRQAAQAQASARRRNRRAVARDLTHYTGSAVDASARFDDDVVDVTRYPYDEIKEVVCDRREADKLGPFQRWAVETTRHLPVEERLDAVRDVMPRNLIGRHALSHVRAMDEFRWMDHDYWWWGRGDRDADEAAERERVVAAVRAALADGRHRELNATMKANADSNAYLEDADEGWVGSDDRCYRPLSGAADVDAFVDEVLGSRYRCRGQAIALRRFAGELR